MYAFGINSFVASSHDYLECNHHDAHDWTLPGEALQEVEESEQDDDDNDHPIALNRFHVRPVSEAEFFAEGWCFAHCNAKRSAQRFLLLRSLLL